MRALFGAALAAMLLMTSGCAIFDKELNNRGGYLDYLADQYWLKADSKRMRVLRAMAIETSLARIAMVTPKSVDDRKLLARRIGDASQRAVYVIDCAYQVGVAPCFWFDSVMVDYVTALFDLALVALPVEDTKKLVNRVAGGVVNPAAAFDALNALIDLGREAFHYGRVVGAIYRDTLELEVQVWLATPAELASSPDLQAKIPPAFQVTEDKVQALRMIYDRGNDDIPAWKTEIAALRAQGFEPIPPSAFLGTLYSLISFICTQITSDDPKDPNGNALTACQFDPRRDLARPPIATSTNVRMSGRRPVVANNRVGVRARVAAIISAQPAGSAALRFR